MTKFINTLVIIAAIILSVLFANSLVAQEPIPWLILLLLLAAIAWLAKSFHKAKQPPEAKLNINAPLELDDLFNSFFGFGSKEHCHQLLKLSKSEAADGCIKPLAYEVRRYCTNCSGSGVDVNGSSTQCLDCDGQGKFTTNVQTMLGTMTSTKACKKCQGMGVITEDPCLHCQGTGFYAIEEQQDITIPENFTEYQIIIPDKGHYIDQYQRGSLVVNVNHKNKKNARN